MGVITCTTADKPKELMDFQNMLGFKLKADPVRGRTECSSAVGGEASGSRSPSDISASAQDTAE
eukprot:6146145-Pyramimonas_sp.AAC.1